MRFSWVMQDLLLRLGGHGGAKQTKPAEAWPLARYASSSIPTPVQVFTLVPGVFLISPGRRGVKPGLPSRDDAMCGAGLEHGAHARAGPEPELVERAWRHRRDQRK